MDGYKFIKGFPSQSYSPTDIWLLESADKRQWIAKIFILEHDLNVWKSAAFFQTEFKAYRTVTANLVRRGLPLYVEAADFKKMPEYSFTELYKYLESQLRGRLPDTTLFDNFVCSTASLFSLGETKTRKAIDDPEGYPKARIEELRRYAAFFKETTFGVIITAYAPGPSLADVLFAPTPPENDLSLLALTLLGVEGLVSLEINQNDLHLGNILVKNHSKAYVIVVYEDKAYVLRVTHTPKIFDFDRVITKGNPVPAMSGYSWGGGCVEYHPNRDALQLACEIYHYSVFREAAISDDMFHVSKSSTRRKAFDSLLEEYRGMYDLETVITRNVPDPELLKCIRRGNCRFEQGKDAVSLLCTETVDHYNRRQVLKSLLQMAAVVIYPWDKDFYKNDYAKGIAVNARVRSKKVLGAGASEDAIRAHVGMYLFTHVFRCLPDDAAAVYKVCEKLIQ